MIHPLSEHFHAIFSQENPIASCFWGAWLLTSCSNISSLGISDEPLFCCFVFHQFCIESRLSIVPLFPYCFIGKFEHPVVFCHQLIFLLAPRFIERKMKFIPPDIIIWYAFDHLPYLRYFSVSIIIEIILKQIKWETRISLKEFIKDIPRENKQRIVLHVGSHTP